MVRSVFHLTLRAAEGFLRSVFHLLEWELPVPDYTTLCKRAKRLAVSLLRTATGPLHLVLATPVHRCGKVEESCLQDPLWPLHPVER